MQRLTEIHVSKSTASDAVRRCKVAGGLPDLRRREYGDAGWAAAACNHTLSLLSRVLAQSTSQGILQLTCMMEPALPGLLASTIPCQEYRHAPLRITEVRGFRGLRLRHKVA